MADTGVSAAKRRVRDARRAEARNRRRAKRERWRCFWTWPLGHEYAGNVCVGCGRTTPVPSSGADGQRQKEPV